MEVVETVKLFDFLDFASLKVAVGPKRSTNRNLKEIITIKCTKTVIFQLLRPQAYQNWQRDSLYNDLL